MCLGIPGQIIEIADAEQSLAIAEFGGVRRRINIACILDAAHPIESCIGDWVLVHVGFALNRLDPDEATETLRLLSELEVVEP